MGTRVAVKMQEAYVQYSKRMCTYVAVFWAFYRIAVSLLIFFRPEITNAMIHLTDGVDTVMIANISFYTGNSVCEKAFIAFGKRRKLNSTDDEDETEDSDEKESKDSGNG